jgi:hypothetical protein
MKFSIYLKQVIHGLMLGDGHLHKKKNTNNNPYYTQTFGQHYELFAKHIFETFKDFCTAKGFYSYLVQSGKDSPFYMRYIVRTVSNSEWNFFYNIYYQVNSLGKTIKIIPSNIEKILTPIVLAYFIMGDGNFHKVHKIIRLCTNSFTKKEVELLSAAIFNKFGIKSRLEHVRNNQYILVFPKSQVPFLQEVVKDYMIPSMLYRIGL